MPKEIRILKYLLMINDPEERVSALKDAFTPGEELQGKDVDFLFTYVDEASRLFSKKLCISLNMAVKLSFSSRNIRLSYSPPFTVCRTPEELHTAIRTVIDAYHSSREGTLVREARDLMNPKIIEKLGELKKLVEDKYM